MSESGVEADLRRVNSLVRPDGSVVIPVRLTPWVRSLIDAAVRDLRRAGRGGNFGTDVLEMLDALAASGVSGSGLFSQVRSKIEVDTTGDVLGEILTSTRAAELLGCTERSVRRALQQGRLRGWKSGARQWLIKAKDLDEFRHGKNSKG